MHFFNLKKNKQIISTIKKSRNCETEHFVKNRNENRLKNKKVIGRLEYVVMEGT